MLLAPYKPTERKKLEDDREEAFALFWEKLHDRLYSYDGYYALNALYWATDDQNKPLGKMFYRDLARVNDDRYETEFVERKPLYMQAWRLMKIKAAARSI